jgi:tRNA-dihydrouridine synthase B
VRSARKHIGWYVKALPGGEVFRAAMNTLEDARQQSDAVADFFDQLNQGMDRLPLPVPDHSLDPDLETTP